MYKFSNKTGPEAEVEQTTEGLNGDLHHSRVPSQPKIAFTTPNSATDVLRAACGASILGEFETVDARSHWGCIFYGTCVSPQISHRRLRLL